MGAMTTSGILTGPPQIGHRPLLPALRSGTLSNVLHRGHLTSIGIAFLSPGTRITLSWPLARRKNIEVEFVAFPAAARSGAWRSGLGSRLRGCRKLRQQAPHYGGNCSKLNQAGPPQTDSMGRFPIHAPGTSEPYSLCASELCSSANERSPGLRLNSSHWHRACIIPHKVGSGGVGNVSGH